MRLLYTPTFAILFLSSFCIAQNASQSVKTAQSANHNVNSENPKQPSPAFLSEVSFEKSECLSSEMSKYLWDQTQESIRQLRLQNPNACQKTSMVHPLFIWPTQPKAGFTDPGYYTITNFVDHNPAFPNQLLDYDCGNRTYDWGSGNHGGTDIILWPYPWRRMAEQTMEIVAAADGIIVFKVDGNYDQNCTLSGSQAWNNIHVLHADGSQSWYLHFKTGSLTSKVVGDSVYAGEYLGTAGSSGSSTIPHLHFEVKDASGNIIDPWDGVCNAINPGDTWWQSQQNYNVPSVNKILTKGTEVDYYNCPNQEITFEKDTFNIGDSLWLWIYTRDLEFNSIAQINLYNPSMQNAINWNFTVPWATLSTSYLRWFYVVDNWWTQGWWTFEVVYGGNTYQHQFYMTQGTVGSNELTDDNIISFYPNPVTDEITLKNKTYIDNIIITDVLGKEVYNNLILKQEPEYKISTSALADGVYFLKINSGKDYSIQKFIKN